MDDSNADSMNLNMTPSSSRTVLPSSVADFAFNSPRSAPPSPSSPVLFMDEYLPSNIRKLRRPSLLGTGAIRPTPSAPHSPLASSYSFGLEDPRRRARSKSAVRPTTRTRQSNSNSESSSGSPAPAMLLDPCSRPSTPPARIPHRRTLSSGTNPFKLPRLASIQSELANPADAELKSEASFQRLLASNADLPGAFHPHPRPRRRDRGRFPEVYLDDEDVVDSDDDDEVMVPKEFPMDDVLDSPARMDVDMGSYGSPPVLGSLFSMKTWRQTPPPTVAPSRIAKRKLDDRYEPYPSKRRALSPPPSASTSSSSNSNSNFNLSMPPGMTPRSPITTAAPAPRPSSLAPSAPIAIPARTPNKSYNYTPGGGGLFGSPIISSPVMRPVRIGLSSRGEKEVDNTGNGVRSLDLGR